MNTPPLTLASPILRPGDPVVFTRWRERSVSGTVLIPCPGGLPNIALVRAADDGATLAVPLIRLIPAS
jgi:hypothetical protein